MTSSHFPYILSCVAQGQTPVIPSSILTQGPKTLVKLPLEVRVQYKGHRASEIATTPKGDRQKAYSRLRSTFCDDLRTLSIAAPLFKLADMDFVWGSGVAKCRFCGPSSVRVVSVEHFDVRRLTNPRDPE